MSLFRKKTETTAAGPGIVPAPPRVPLARRIGRSLASIPVFVRDTFLRLLTFLFFLMFYVVARLSFSIIHRVRKFLHRADESESREILFARFSARFLRLLRSSRPETIDKMSLIEVAIRNMKVKKTRTAITVGGMALGIASIVFLVSIGYGLQNLVISQVARLDEMRQADVSPQAGGKIRIDDKTLADFGDVTDVDLVAPLIAVVGRVNYQNSVSDMAAYGVTTEYLSQSAMQLVSGRFFESNELSAEAPDHEAVLGVSDERAEGESGERSDDELVASGDAPDVSSTSKDWVRVRITPDTAAETIGYARISGTPVRVTAVEGSAYRSRIGYGGDEESGVSGIWAEGDFELWKAVGCEPTDDGCEDGFRQARIRKTNEPEIGHGFFALASDTLSVRGLDAPEPKVLGESTESGAIADVTTVTADVDGTPTTGDEWEGLLSAEESGTPSSDALQVTLGEAARREAVVNRAMLRVLGIDEANAVGTPFSVSFVVTGNLLDGDGRKVESVPADYRIVGVIPDDKTPLLYVPFIDLRSIGISNYSQVKLAVRAADTLESVRRKIESMGYVTTSVADTVEQINSFFGTARIVLGLLGMAALGVAALGMFNTLTVSLLERTREVGLMKAMGMKSSEVQELFLTESMVMSFFGGVIGLLLGWGAGKLLGSIITALALVRDRGFGFLDVSYIPPSFVIAILAFSVVVGVFTGLYPAHRATKISALNALRYE